jgi:putative membrane protein
MTAIETCIRNLTRSFLTCSHVTGKRPSEEERADTEQAVRLLLALIYAAKNHLRAEWGMNVIPFLLPKSAGDMERRHRRESTSVHQPEYEDLLPSGIRGFEDQGLGLLLQLSIRIESYIKRGHDRGWFHSPQASQMTVQLNSLVSAYGSMETIHLTPLPVAYLIHMRQVLALFIGVLPFALVEEMGWYTVLMVSLVCFTLYGSFSHNNNGNTTRFHANLLPGIDAIGAQVCIFSSITTGPELRAHFCPRAFANMICKSLRIPSVTTRRISK